MSDEFVAEISKTWAKLSEQDKSQYEAECTKLENIKKRLMNARKNIKSEIKDIQTILDEKTCFFKERQNGLKAKLESLPVDLVQKERSDYESLPVDLVQKTTLDYESLPVDLVQKETSDYKSVLADHFRTLRERHEHDREKYGRDVADENQRQALSSGVSKMNEVLQENNLECTDIHPGTRKTIMKKKRSPKEISLSRSWKKLA